MKTDYDETEKRFAYSMNFEEIAKVLGVTRARVSQIEKQALAKLKKRFPVLKEYLKRGKDG